MIFDTKIAIILRDDLAVWQKLNVAAFLMGGIVGAAPQIIGEPYCDAAGHAYSSLPIQPLIILAGDQALLSAIQRRALQRQVRVALYIEEMFGTNHDAANRAMFAQFGPDNARPWALPCARSENWSTRSPMARGCMPEARAAHRNRKTNGIAARLWRRGSL